MTGRTPRLRLGWSAVLVLAACSSPWARPASDRAADEAAVRAVVDEAVAAHHAGDAVRWMTLVTPDVVLMLDGDSAIVGSDAVSASVRDFFTQNASRIAVQVEEVQVDGDLAFLRTHDTGSFMPKAGGPPIAIDFKELIVFRRQRDGVWKAARIMVNENRPHGPTAIVRGGDR